MLVIGAKGFAKEILHILEENNELNQLAFYDDLNLNHIDRVFNKFPIIKSINNAIDYFKAIDNKFTIGIGNSHLRYAMYKKFADVNGLFTSTISRNIDIGKYEVNIGDGCNILSGVKISNCVEIGTGCIVYYNSIITHDVQIGQFVEISPGAILLGGCKIGDFTHIGSGAIVLPYIRIGKNVVIAAGAVATKDVPDNVMIAGIPAVVKKDFSNNG